MLQVSRKGVERLLASTGTPTTLVSIVYPVICYAKNNPCEQIQRRGVFLCTPHEIKRDIFTNSVAYASNKSLMIFLQWATFQVSG